MVTIKEHKEQMAVAIDSLNQEISKSKDYVNSKFSILSGEVQDIKQHNAAEISQG